MGNEREFVWEKGVGGMSGARCIGVLQLAAHGMKVWRRGWEIVPPPKPRSQNRGLGAPASVGNDEMRATRQHARHGESDREPLVESAQHAINTP
jgi:hypothetical protein